MKKRKLLKRTAKWQKRLTAREWRHLCEDAVDPGVRPTLRSIRNNREHQVKNGIECFECKHIAIKLGLEEPDAPIQDEYETTHGLTSYGQALVGGLAGPKDVLDSAIKAIKNSKEGEPMQEKFAMEDILKEVRMGLGLEDTPDNYEDQEHPLFEKISGLFEQTLQGCYFCDPYADMNSPRVEVCPACQIKLVRILTVCGVDTTKVPLLKDIPVPKIRRAVTIAKKSVH